MKTSQQPASPRPGFISDISLTLPTVDIVTYALDLVDNLGADHVVYAEADKPENCILAGDVRSMVKVFASEFVAFGVKAGDCVCIHSANSVSYPIWWLATIATGGIVTGSNPSYTTNELAHHFKVTDTKFVITEHAYLSVVKDALLEFGISPNNIIVRSSLGTSADRTQYGGDASISWQELAQSKTCKHLNFNDEETQTNTIAVHAATSGTTGLPKAAEISHRYLVAQVANLEHVFSTRSITTFFMPRFDLVKYVYHVQQLCITDSAVVPPIIGALSSIPNGSLSTIRYMVCAGAPMNASVQTDLYSKLGKNSVIGQCWGTTELGWISLFGPCERDINGSVGRLLPNTKLKIVDENGNIVTTDDTPGEARIKSASMFKSYKHATTANDEAFDDDGYCCTGDIVLFKNGKIYVTGRIKDTMKVNGWQVSPEEVEKVIFDMSGVADCAVVSHNVFNSETGLEETRPRAFVVLQPYAYLTESDIMQHVRQSLVAYKRLSGGVVFIDAIPRSNTGKILRRKLIREEEKACSYGTVMQTVTVPKRLKSNIEADGELLCYVNSIRTMPSSTEMDGQFELDEESSWVNRDTVTLATASSRTLDGHADSVIEICSKGAAHESLIQQEEANTLGRYCLSLALIPICCVLGAPGFVLLGLLAKLIGCDACYL